ncbi:MAG: LamG domain-containing protein [Sedimentisphaerales bacterium]|nr:LamG domain-containing protein [Sedimentisphaerales bacterium]
MEKKKLKLLVCALAIGLGVSLANADIETGLVAYWAFEDGSGSTTAADSGPNGYTGTLMGTPEWDSGPDGFGGALLFDIGWSGDVVHCGTACDPGDIFTLALWAYWNGNTAPYTSVHFLTKSDGWAVADMRWQWELFAGNTNPLRTDLIGISCHGPGSVMLTADPMPDNEWVHLVVTFDGTDAALFINGVADSLGPQAFSIGTKTDAEFLIGCSNTSYPRRSFDGLLDEVRVYSRVLSVDDIQALASPDPDYNFAPSVDAGSYQSILWQTPSVTVQLDGAAGDDGKPLTDPCDPCSPPIGLTLTWSKLSGPGNVTFDPCDGVEDPIATFDAAGFYELRLRGYDGEEDACDVVVIYVRPDNNPIAYWNFNEGSDPVDDDSANNNEGARAGDKEPNWVSGWVGSDALKFYGETDPCVIQSYVDVTTDSTIDPNLDNIRYAISLSAWIRVDAVNGEFPIIIANGNNSWRLGVMTNAPIGRIYFSCQGLGTLSVYSNTLVNDGYWHHVAGVWDGSTHSIYIDGVLENSQANSGLISLNDLPVTIGARATSATEVQRSWNGLIDDLRVHSYGISEAQVQALAAMGINLAPHVDAGDNQTFVMQYGYLKLDATVHDDSKPEAATLEWTQTSGPGTATFDPCNIEDPCVTFSDVGTYVLRLTADDTLATIYDEVEITVEDPICQDVIDDGLLITGDFSGPAGTPDCRINLYDFAAFAGNWLRCNNPQDTACDFPY